MQNTTSDFLEILRTLSEYKVDFIVVGGVCAVLHGAPMTTFDLPLRRQLPHPKGTFYQLYLRGSDTYQAPIYL